MSPTPMQGKRFPMSVFCLVILFLPALVISTYSHAQVQSKFTSNRAVNGEMAFCTIKVDNVQKKGRRMVITGSKSYQVTPNQNGSFDRVSNIRPLQKVPVEIYYPNGRIGQKVVISVEDGGTLDDDARVKVLSLNAQSRIFFNFQMAKDPGIYRATVRKGNDTKEVVLWVGAEASYQD